MLLEYDIIRKNITDRDDFMGDIKNIIFYTTPAHGHINPALPLLSRLIDSGYSVIAYSTEEFREIIEKSGAALPENYVFFGDQKRYRLSSGQTIVDLAEKAVRDDYYFDMKGAKVLRLATKKVPAFMDKFLTDTGITIDDIDFFIPHQASKALKLIMRKLKIPEGKYIDKVDEWGNMISAAIPMALYTAIRQGYIKHGDRIALFGTAAGLTILKIFWRYFYV